MMGRLALRQFADADGVILKEGKPHPVELLNPVAL